MRATFFHSFRNSWWQPVEVAGRPPASCFLCDRPAVSMVSVKPLAEVRPVATYTHRGLPIQSYRASPFKVRSPNSAMVCRLASQAICRNLTSRRAPSHGKSGLAMDSDYQQTPRVRRGERPTR